MGIIFVPFIMIVAGLAMDLSKSVYAKSSFQSFSQEAANNATRTVNNQGDLTFASVRNFIDYYNAQTNNQSGGVDLSGTTPATKDGEAAVWSQTGRTGPCQKVKGPAGDDKTAPYIQLNFYNKRSYKQDSSADSQESFVSEGGSYPTTPSSFTPGLKVLTATVYDSVPNIMLGMAGKPCQRIISNVSSVVFLSQEDVDKFYGATTTSVGTCPSNITRNTTYYHAPGTTAWLSQNTVSWTMVSPNDDANVNVFATYGNPVWWEGSMGNTTVTESTGTATISAWLGESSPGVNPWLAYGWRHELKITDGSGVTITC
jgi:Flp pilus assembly protein TadG